MNKNSVRAWLLAYRFAALAVGVRNVKYGVVRVRCRVATDVSRRERNNLSFLSIVCLALGLRPILHGAA